MLYEINNILPARNGNWVRVLRGSRVLLRGHSIGWGYTVPFFSSSCFFRVYASDCGVFIFTITMLILHLKTV